MTFDRLLTRDQIAELPGLDNARLIWEKRNTRVTLHTRMVAQEVMANQRSSTLGELLSRILAVGGTADELLSLIANGTLQIDLSTAMSSLTTVRKHGAGQEEKASCCTGSTLMQTGLRGGFNKGLEANYTRNV